jgi:predicted NBD/HSP70 family sugar kinase
MSERKVLVIDVGGSKVKLWHPDSEQKRSFPSGKELSASRMAQQVLETAHDWQHDRVALGLPCRVVAGHPIEEPQNLGSGWIDLDYRSALGVPVRIVNDAALQALGCYREGRLLFIGLGTGIGSTLVVEGMAITLDLGRLRHTSGERLFELLSKEAFKRLGKKVWQEAAEEIIPRLKSATFADDVVIGGGLAEDLDPLPDHTRRVSNGAVLAGGIRLWEKRIAHEHEEDAAWRFV